MKSPTYPVLASIKLSSLFHKSNIPWNRFLDVKNRVYTLSRVGKQQNTAYGWNVKESIPPIWSDLNGIILIPSNLRWQPTKQAVSMDGLKPQ